jgi:hypothetical protein
VNFHANCCPIASTSRGRFPASPFLASTTALKIPIAMTSTAGTAVQRISRPVCPWIGGPSASSSSGTRHFQTEKRTTAPTSEKIAMEMTVANQ